METESSVIIEWLNGVGYLPGSDLKFKRNEFGLIEVVDDNMEEGALKENKSRRVREESPDITVGYRKNNGRNSSENGTSAGNTSIVEDNRKKSDACKIKTKDKGDAEDSQGEPGLIEVETEGLLCQDDGADANVEEHTAARDSNPGNDGTEEQNEASSRSQVSERSGLIDKDAMEVDENIQVNEIKEKETSEELNEETVEVCVQEVTFTEAGLDANALLRVIPLSDIVKIESNGFANAIDCDAVVECINADSAMDSLVACKIENDNFPLEIKYIKEEFHNAIQSSGGECNKVDAAESSMEPDSEYLFCHEEIDGDDTLMSIKEESSSSESPVVNGPTSFSSLCTTSAILNGAHAESATSNSDSPLPALSLNDTEMETDNCLTEKVENCNEVVVKKKQVEEDTIQFCQCCGCYGLKSEFYEMEYCTKACHDTVKYLADNPGKLRKSATPKKFKLMDCEANTNGDHPAALDGNSWEGTNTNGFSDLEVNKAALKKKSKNSKQRKAKSRLTTKVQGKDGHGTKGDKSAKNVKNKGTNGSAINSKDKKKNFPVVLKTVPLAVTPNRNYVQALTRGFQISPDITQGKPKFVQIVRPNIAVSDFDWTKYLTETKSKAAPQRLFRQPAMPLANPFKCGMTLEAIDPQHQSLICVVSVQEIQGYRVKLRFEGFSEAYDFWVNADSLDIFPAGWCKENQLELQPPPGVPEPFDWEAYAAENDLVIADRELFAVTKDEVIPDDEVAPGMKMEAVDIRSQNLVCVATVAKVMGERILVHFDSWDSIYDYWTDFTSPFIHPVGWCDKNGVKLTPPNNFETDFNWETYLKETNSKALPPGLFRPLPPIAFRKGFKIECVDKRNPYLIRVATISEVEEHNLLIHFDNWPEFYDYKVYELSPDIHPVGWCAHTGHQLQPPPPADGTWKGPCTVFGCLGQGHIRGPKFLTHNGEKNCPYASHNYKKDWILADRAIVMERSYGHGLNDNSSSVESCTTLAEQVSETLPTASKSKSSPSSKSKAPKPIAVREKRASTSAIPEGRPKRQRISRKSKSSSSSSSRTPSPAIPFLTPIDSLPPDSSGKNLSSSPPVIENEEADSLPNAKTEEVPGCSKDFVLKTSSNNSLSSPPRKKKSISTSSSDSNAVPSSNFKSGTSNDPEETPPNFATNSVCLKTVVGDLREETVSRWKVEQLSEFIATIPACEHTATIFLEQLIDGESFLMLSQTDFLQAMNLKLGPAIKLCNVIKMISANSARVAARNERVFEDTK